VKISAEMDTKKPGLFSHGFDSHPVNNNVNKNSPVRHEGVTRLN
jgi:hypothetical protein